MLTKVTIRNFKRFGEVEIELGNPVVFIGPNDSGKTSALQALTLWHIGVRRWLEKRRGKQAPEKRPGVTINRRDLIAIPVPDANLLWRDLHVRDIQTANGRAQKTRNIRIDVIVDGVTAGKQWTCGLEFDYANQESLYCRPLRLGEDPRQGRMPVPEEEVSSVNVAFLPPMSGLAANETRLDRGAIDVRLGEGRTAEVLRNLCYLVVTPHGSSSSWKALTEHVQMLFGVYLQEPTYIAERGEIVMAYRDRAGLLDLSSSGRGLQQTLLLLAYLYANPSSALLLDEPDAHLEILRQRQIYALLTDVARQQGSQVIAASHSEVVLNEAADRDVVVAFVGRPHRIDDRGSQVLKALKEIGYDQYYQAEQTGWGLYVEGSTDLAILKAFARTLGHPAASCLEKPFVHYVQNQPEKAYSHFFGLREAKGDLVGVAVLDHLERDLEDKPGMRQAMWQRREIESYLCLPQVLLRYAETSGAADSIGPLFAAADSETRRRTMDECIRELVPPVALGDPNHRYWITTKVSDDFLEPLFESYFSRLGLPNLMRKSDYHELAGFVVKEEIPSEVVETLDAVVRTADEARPAEEPDFR